MNIILFFIEIVFLAVAAAAVVVPEVVGGMITFWSCLLYLISNARKCLLRF